MEEEEEEQLPDLNTTFVLSSPKDTGHEAGFSDKQVNLMGFGDSGSSGHLLVEGQLAPKDNASEANKSIEPITLPGSVQKPRNSVPQSQTTSRPQTSRSADQVNQKTTEQRPKTAEAVGSISQQPPVSKSKEESARPRTSLGIEGRNKAEVSKSPPNVQKKAIKKRPKTAFSGSKVDLGLTDQPLSEAQRILHAPIAKHRPYTAGVVLGGTATFPGNSEHPEGPLFKTRPFSPLRSTGSQFLDGRPRSPPNIPCHEFVPHRVPSARTRVPTQPHTLALKSQNSRVLDIAERFLDSPLLKSPKDGLLSPEMSLAVHSQEQDQKKVEESHKKKKESRSKSKSVTSQSKFNQTAPLDNTSSFFDSFEYHAVPRPATSPPLSNSVKPEELLSFLAHTQNRNRLLDVTPRTISLMGSTFLESKISTARQKSRSSVRKHSSEPLPGLSLEPISKLVSMNATAGKTTHRLEMLRINPSLYGPFSGKKETCPTVRRLREIMAREERSGQHCKDGFGPSMTPDTGHSVVSTLQNKPEWTGSTFLFDEQHTGGGPLKGAGKRLSISNRSALLSHTRSDPIFVTSKTYKQPSVMSSKERSTQRAQLLKTLENALESVSKNDILELGAMRRPGQSVIMVAEALCVVFGMHPLSWKTAHKQLLRNSYTLISLLGCIDPDAVTEKRFLALKQYIQHPLMQPEVVRLTSKPMVGLCRWLHSLYAVVEDRLGKQVEQAIDEPPRLASIFEPYPTNQAGEINQRLESRSKSDVELGKLLIDACQRDSLGPLKELAGELEGPNYFDELGRHAVHYATSAEAVQILIDLWGNEPSIIDAVDRNGATPLMLACRDGYLAAAKALVQFGANPHLKDSHNLSAGEGFQENVSKETQAAIISFLGVHTAVDEPTPSIQESLPVLNPADGFEVEEAPLGDQCAAPVITQEPMDNPDTESARAPANNLVDSVRFVNNGVEIFDSLNEFDKVHQAEHQDSIAVPAEPGKGTGDALRNLELQILSPPLSDEENLYEDGAECSQAGSSQPTAKASHVGIPFGDGEQPSSNEHNDHPGEYSYEQEQDQNPEEDDYDDHEDNSGEDAYAEHPEEDGYEQSGEAAYQQDFEASSILPQNMEKESRHDAHSEQQNPDEEEYEQSGEDAYQQDFDASSAVPQNKENESCNVKHPDEDEYEQSGEDAYQQDFEASSVLHPNMEKESPNREHPQHQNSEEGDEHDHYEQSGEDAYQQDFETNSVIFPDKGSTKKPGSSSKDASEQKLEASHDADSENEYSEEEDQEDT